MYSIKKRKEEVKAYGGAVVRGTTAMIYALRRVMNDIFLRNKKYALRAHDG